MKKNNYDEKICARCENGRCLIDEESVLCRHKGVVALDFTCRRFVFDPLKVKKEAVVLKPSKIETL